jgi:hypothetical protein
MPWVKLSDDWYDDPAIVVLDDHGIAMWVLGLSWCARNLTDGVIPDAIVRRFTTHPEPPSVAARLVELGLWSAVEGGFQVENYHGYQPTRAEVLGKRAKDAERKASKRSGGSPRGLVADSVDRPVPPVPGPGPGPVTPSSSVSECLQDGSPQVVDDDGSDEGRKAVAWSTIAAWKADEKGKTGNTRWVATTRRNQPHDEHPEGGSFDSVADRLLASYPSLTGRELAEALVGRLSKRSLAIRAVS